MTLSEIARLLRTARHLKWPQLFWRLRYRLGRRTGGARRRAVGRPAVSDLVPEVPVFRLPGPTGEGPVDLAERGEFEHLNLRRGVGRGRPDWRLGPVESERLWTVTLHYHEWAYALAEVAACGGERGERAVALFRRYVSDWIERCGIGAPGALDLAWNPFAVATRLGWWARAWMKAHEILFAGDERFEEAFLVSMRRQAAYLHDNIEWDLRANHLVRDVVGLAWAGRFFGRKNARRWLRTATRLAVSQVDEQILPDGGHFERSPMYHLQVMEDVLSLALLLEDEHAAGRMRDAWTRMAEYLRWVRHPDGNIPLLNDAALNGARGPGRMLSSGKCIGAEPEDALPHGGRHFPDTGIVTWHGDPWTLFFDVGPLGPDYQPGHGHADTLSLECSFRGKRLFVDPGTHSYDNDDRRRYDRSTRAHNTVCIDGADSSEVWHIFRVGRRARPRSVQVSFSGGELVASASHDGYRHLAGRPMHGREIRVGPSGVMTVIDRVTGSSHHTCEGGLLVGPGWKAEEEPGGWSLSQGAARLRVEVKGPEGLELALESRPYHPEFGLELQRP
ncbi:MAG: heparinase II/III domain-containing protein, partial [Planctomycetota bacterium]